MFPVQLSYAQVSYCLPRVFLLIWLPGVGTNSSTLIEGGMTMSRRILLAEHAPIIKPHPLCIKCKTWSWLLEFPFWLWNLPTISSHRGINRLLGNDHLVEPHQFTSLFRSLDSNSGPGCTCGCVGGCGWTVQLSFLTVHLKWPCEERDRQRQRQADRDTERERERERERESKYHKFRVVAHF